MTDAERYRSPYSEDSPYGIAVSLLARHARVEAAGAVMLDVGCGYGAIAEAVRRLGLVYVGVDNEQAGLADLARRGFETAMVDLSEDGRLAEALAGTVGERPLGAITALDAIEHLTNGAELLAVLRRLAVDAGGAPLVISIPNVTHLDLGAKLLLGRWDVTPVGLLDVTHVSLYSPARLERTFEEAGWREVDAADFLLSESDQHFPALSAPLAETPLRGLLARIRTRAAPGALTNQFLRAFLPEPLDPGDVAIPGAQSPAPPGPFLSVLLLAGAAGDDRDDGLEDVLLSIEAQRSTDFELIVLAGGGEDPSSRAVAERLATLSPELASRTRLVPAPTQRGLALEAGADQARGRYLAVLDRRSVLFPHYVESFARLATERPGAVLRCLAAAQALRRAPDEDGGRRFEAAGPPVLASRRRFLLDEHVFEPLSPPGSYALACSCFTDLGLSFAGAVRGAEEEELLIEATMLCGVHESPGEVGLVRRRLPGDGLDGADHQARQLLAEKLDAGPLLLPPGSIARFWERREALRLATEHASAADASEERANTEQAEALRLAQSDLAAARRELVELRSSTSWRVTGPLRRLTGRLRPPP